MTNIVIAGDDNQVTAGNGSILQQKNHLSSGKNVFRAIGNWIMLLVIGLLVTGIGYMTIVLINR